MNLDNLNNLIELFSLQVSKQNKKDIFLEWLNPSNKKTYCVMNDKSIKMTNVYIEPTCIFKGRGNHPMRGFVKEQVNHNDVIINASYTPHPEVWKSVICDPSHQWLATS